MQETMTTGDLRGYAICTAPRSGSAFLCQLLDSTGVLGRPYEFFNPEIKILPGMADHPADPASQLERIITRGATPNGVYGFKLFAAQADLAAKTRWPTVLPNLKCLRLIRRDTLGQALSLARAHQTGQYRWNFELTGSAVYDREKIQSLLVRVVKIQARWELYFARIGLQPLTLVYEDVVERPQAAVDAIAALMRVQGAVCDFSRVEIQIQRDAVSAEWRQRFLAEATDRDLIDQL